ncbi:MAG: 2-oxoglutarate dehydrogenase E1 component [Deltaproteobacteria bacterium]|nr:2-oxoglutarate dehydrogenase E1 component [Deltaproteobacteria bacterium]
MNPPTDDPGIASLGYSDEVYEQYRRDPASVPDDWRAWFQAIERGEAAPAAALDRACQPQVEFATRQLRVDQLVRAFRMRGHRAAALDPLGRPRPPVPDLEPAAWGLGPADLDAVLPAGTLTGVGELPLRRALERLRESYCRSIGVEFMHIDDASVRQWLQARMEPSANRVALSHEEQLRILTRLTDAVIFEEFVQRRFVGAKSFSLEGAESLIPLLDLAFERAGAQGIGDIVIGMAHRGRLNVLVNLLGKRPHVIFHEFEEVDGELHIGSGDVKYHLGRHGDWVTSTGRTVHLALCFNPSHLEFVNPVALGLVRARQDRSGDADGSTSLGILVHGDAAFAGEGIVQETLNFAGLAAYRTGGTLHVMVNNQIGFTTEPGQGRSSPYATDVAKLLQAPVFHVNGEDAEAVAQAVTLALEFRREFHRDVVVDMYAFRRRGHSETDEPSFTQPLLYAAIRRRPPVREAYLKRLLALGEVTAEQAAAIERGRRAELEREFELSHADAPPDPPEPVRPGGVAELWCGFHGGPEAGVPEFDTGVARATLARLLEATVRVPDGFHVHEKLQKLHEARRSMARGEIPLDWAAGEALAFATVAVEGRRVRVTGQDTERGTFSHRHAVLHDAETGAAWEPLAHLEPGQAPVEIRNSPLSEAGCMGFEYGYSLSAPDALVAWEAQFGDFANVAQVIIDQFLAASEVKWGMLSGLVLLLPHGFEGMGPEHSSARLERFLMLAVGDNLQVAQPSTPAQLFHLLRRQALRTWRKPLIVLTPKSMLRHPRAVSPLDELAKGRFRRVLGDPLVPGSRARRVLLVAGKLYYDLVAEREARGRDDVALVRLEQFYPLPEAELLEAMGGVPDGVPVRWVQEEPGNMGAWPYLRLRFGERLAGRWAWSAIHRAESSSPATGSAASHKLEQRRLVQQAFEED